MLQIRASPPTHQRAGLLTQHSLEWITDEDGEKVVQLDLRGKKRVSCCWQVVEVRRVLVLPRSWGVAFFEEKSEGKWYLPITISEKLSDRAGT